jgi:hypothetical protein
MFSTFFLFLMAMFGEQEIRQYRHMEVACTQVSADVVDCNGVR